MKNNKFKKNDLERQNDTCDNSSLGSEQDQKKNNLSNRALKNGKLEIGKEEAHGFEDSFETISSISSVNENDGSIGGSATLSKAHLLK